jgi:hypothetical protein
VWIAASRGIDATDEWHDVTGYAIVGAVFVGTLAAAAFLAKRGAAGVANAETHVKRERAKSTLRLRPIHAALPLIWLITVEVAVEAWYRKHERGLIVRQAWTVRWPESAPNFRDLQLDDRMSGILRFDEGRGATWLFEGRAAAQAAGGDAQPSGPTSPVNLVVYFFRWDAGRSSILRARGHRPDICLPSAGWIQKADHGARNYSAGDVSLPFRHFEFARGGENKLQPTQIAHAFFCVDEDRVRPVVERPETQRELNEMQGFTLLPKLWRLVRTGARPHGQQVMQAMFVGPKQPGPEEAQARFAELVQGLVVIRPHS